MLTGFNHDVLEQAIERFETGWEVQYDPVVATIADHPRLAALFDSIDQRIAGLGAELGMPPASI